MSFAIDLRGKSIYPSLASISLTVLLWELLSSFVGRQYFPGIWAVLNDVLELLSQSFFWQSLVETLGILSLSLVLGMALSLALGVALSLNKSFGDSFSGLISFVRCIPAVAILPIFIASWGARVTSVVALTVLVVAFKLVTYVIRGFQQAQLELLDYARATRLSLFRKIVAIYLPGSLSSIATGLRVTAILAYGTVVACGVAAGTPGIGSSLLLAEESASHTRVFSYVLVMGFTGVLVNNVFVSTQRRLDVTRMVAA